MSAPPGWAWADPCLDEGLGDHEADADIGVDVQPRIGAGASRAPSPTLEQLVGDSAGSSADRGDGPSKGSPPPGTSAKTREDEDAPGENGQQQIGGRKDEDAPGEHGSQQQIGGRKEAEDTPGAHGSQQQIGGRKERQHEQQVQEGIETYDQSRCRPSDARTAVALGCLFECGRKANLPRFQTCCMACPREHTGQCALREGLLWCAHACGAKANLPRVDTCCRYCPRRHTLECALRQEGCPPQHPPPTPKKRGRGGE